MERFSTHWVQSIPPAFSLCMYPANVCVWIGGVGFSRGGSRWVEGGPRRAVGGLILAGLTRDLSCEWFPSAPCHQVPQLENDHVSLCPPRWHSRPLCWGGDKPELRSVTPSPGAPGTEQFLSLCPPSPGGPPQIKSLSSEEGLTIQWEGLGSRQLGSSSASATHSQVSQASPLI